MVTASAHSSAREEESAAPGAETGGQRCNRLPPSQSVARCWNVPALTANG
jgi:hypothetical protein